MRDFNIVFLENVLTKGTALLLFLLVARSLGPEKYGSYSIVTVSILFLVPFLDLGMENVAVRFSGKYESKREEIYCIYFLFKIMMAGIFCLIILVSPQTIVTLLNKPEVDKYLFIIYMGFLMESFRYIIASYYQSTEQFITRAVVNLGTLLLRLVSIFILLKMSIDNVRTITIFFALSSTPFIILFFKQGYVFLKSFMSSGIDKDTMVEIYHYGKWNLLASFPVRLMMRLDFYVVAYLASFKDVGLYNSAVQLVSFFSFIPVVVGTVFLPKVSKYKSIENMRNFIRKAIKIGVPVTITVLLTIPLSEPLIRFFLGEEYVQSFPIFQILLLAFIFTLWNVMFGTVFYAMGKIKYMTLGAYVQLVLFAASVFFFAVDYGFYAVVWSKVFANAAFLGVVIYFLTRILKSTETEHAF